ncbi:MAG: hypothetical protein ACR2J8_03350, partial [Thermomicrobiales bacterium]
MARIERVSVGESSDKSAIVGQVIAALSNGARERAVANQGIIALQNDSAFEAAKGVAAETLQSLGHSLVRLQQSAPAADLVGLHQAVDDLA